MADEQKGPIAAGFSLLWRRQGILWWVFVMNFVCGALGTAPAAMHLDSILHSTLAGEKLSKGFDVGMFVELTRLPYAKLFSWTTSSYIFAFVFFVFMIFVLGGILETYRQDRRLSTGEFFAASGEYFWRFVRLVLLSLVPFVLVSMIYQGMDKAADRIGDKAVADQVGAYLSIAAVVIFLLLALIVRLWFDIAQVRAVAQGERRMWRNTWRSLRITWGGFGKLFRMYFAISLMGWIVLAAGLAIWAKLPPTATPVTFVLLEVLLLVQLMTRFWQLASAMTWYQRHAEMVPMDSVDFTTPHSVEVVETSPPALVDTASAADIDRRPDAELELPPADA